jgi:hypothetical protein
MRDLATAIAGLNSMDTLQGFKHCLCAPKAAATEDS